MLGIGSIIDGKYKILSEIGHGGMSVVYMAINEKANKTWAVKEVRKNGVVDFDAVKQGLIVETEMLKKLSHPHLPSIIDVIEEEDTFLIVMDYIEGNSLSKSLAEYGAQPQEQVIDWAMQLCDVLGYLHSRNIIYRDMKPSNVMLKPDGNLMLIDFGTAREFKEKNLADTTCLGTIGYAAPEQFGGKGQTDARTDIYCLGATLYHLVTGKDPCEPPYELLPIRQVNPNLSDGLQRIIQKCTQKNPEDRYQSCAELLYALEHYGELDDKYRKKQKRKLGAFITTVSLTVALGGVSVWGYASAEKVKSNNYDVLFAKASDPSLEAEERTQLYLEAITTDATKKDAYLDMINMFLSGEEDHGLTKSEAGVFTQLQAGVDTENEKGYSETRNPLSELEAANPEIYAAVCYEIGCAYWYDYEVESDRYTSAVTWFEKAQDFFPAAKIYCEIGECQEQIKKYSDQSRTEKMYEAYSRLWQKLCQLQETVQPEDNEMKLLVWEEIVITISEKIQYFIANIQIEELSGMLDKIEEASGQLKSTTSLKEDQASVDKIQTQIETARTRIITVAE